MNLLIIMTLSFLSFSADKTAKAQDTIQVPAQGQVDNEGIKQVFQMNAAKISKCYNDHTDGKMEGKVVLDFDINQKGKVIRAAIAKEKSTMTLSPAFENCLTGYLKEWMFPPAPKNSESVQVYYPLGFSRLKR